MNVINRKIGGGKLYNVVILRSFAIVAVVLYHCFCPWLYAWDWLGSNWRPLYSYIFEGILVGRMPLFICVSGYLFSYLFNEKGKYNTFTSFIKNKTRRLLLPCALFSLIYGMTFHENLVNTFFYGGGHLWFLKMLFICFIVCWILGRFVKGYWQGLCLCFSILLMFAPQVNFFSIGQFTKYFVFFYTGFLLCKNRLELKTYLGTRNALICHSLVYLAMCLLLLYLYSKNWNMTYGDIIHKDTYVKCLLILMRVYTIPFAFSLVDNILSSKSQISKVFNSINDCSYGIYLLHFYFLMLIQSYALQYFKYLESLPPFIGPFLVFVVIFSLSYYLTFLIKKNKIGSYLL